MASGLVKGLPDTIAAWSAVVCLTGIFGSLGLWCTRNSCIGAVAVLAVSIGAWAGYSRKGELVVGHDASGVVFLFVLSAYISLWSSVLLLSLRTLVRGGAFLWGCFILCWLGILLGMSVFGNGRLPRLGLQGHVIRATGMYLYRDTFDELRPEQLWMAPHPQQIASVVPLGSSSVLLSTDWAEHSALYVLELPNKKVRRLRSGTMACYLVEDDLVLFYNRDRDDQFAKYTLCSAPLSNVDTASPIEDAPEEIRASPFKLMSPPVAISAHEAVFVGDNRKLKIYDSRGNRVTTTGLTNLVPQVYRSRTHSLICHDASTYGTVELTLNDMGVAPINGISPFGNRIYLPNLDMLLYSKTIGRIFPPGHKERMCVFDLIKGREIEIGDGYVGRGYWVAP